MNVRRGIEAERKCKQELEARGYHVSRSAASKGEYDIIAVGRKDILLIQVKRTGNPYRKFAKADILKLKNAKAPISEIVKKQFWCWIDKIGWEIKEL